MTVPWIEVIEPACIWADDKVTIADCAAECTIGLYDWDRIVYPLYTPGFPSRWVNGTTHMFMLTNLLNTSGIVQGKCVDVASYLCLSLASIGVSVQQERHYAEGSSGGHVVFVTNPVMAIGWDWGLGNEINIAWLMDQTCLVSDLNYDACLAMRLDLSGAFYQKPPAGWPLAGYWQTPDGAGNFVGLVKRYAH